MSDFDKEAERERLREKYEAEEQDREATQHMSELLLKGATMTNSHCGTCGDPIFRHDGQEFCPTCQTQTAADGEDATATADDARQGTDATSATTQRTTTEDGPDARRRQQSTDARRRQQSTDARRKGDERGTDAPTTGTQPTGRTPATGPADHQATTGGSDAPNANVDADAAANVEATVERFAAAAANTDDPERAREYLATVRDATETLRALHSDAR